jgi:hypothetical protein
LPDAARGLIGNKNVNNIDDGGPSGARQYSLLTAAIPALIAVFFMALYLYMTMSGEDISQFAVSSRQSCAATLQDTYHYLPRLGELYQRVIIRYYEPIAQWNWRALPRIVDGLWAVLFVYCSAWLALRRRPKLDPESALAGGTIFIMMMLTPVNMIFLSRFSFLRHGRILQPLALTSTMHPTAIVGPAKNRKQIPVRLKHEPGWTGFDGLELSR